MKTREYCALVAKSLGCSPELVFSVFTACIIEGKRLMARGEEWRLPGLGKLYCKKLPPRRSSGNQDRDLDAETPRLRAVCEFSPFRPVLEAAADEDVET